MCLAGKVMETEHILVVDDNRDIREDLRSYLLEHGYRVSVGNARRLHGGSSIPVNRIWSCWM